MVLVSKTLRSKLPAGTVENLLKPENKDTLVSIRPERVEVKAELLPADAHLIEAEVVEVIYMGDLFRTVLKVAGHDDFVIKSRNTLGQRVLTPGEKIRIGWAPADARALDPV